LGGRWLAILAAFDGCGMATATAHLNLARRLRPLALAAFAAAVICLPVLYGSAPLGIDPELLEGRAPTAEELRPSVEAAFQAESYKPGDLATLSFFNQAPGVTVQLFHTGPEHVPTVGNSELQGVAVSAAVSLGAVSTGHTARIKVGNWPSGVYFARLASTDGRVGFAPIVVRPKRLGTFRVAVVMPTMTWQAYNIRDDNGDGLGDSWYFSWKVKTAHLFRPYLDRGVPYHFRNYDLPFLHWLSWTGHDADILSDSDLESVASSKTLALAYDLIIFPGHHEYVTTREYAIVRGYRDLGGNLAFLSANNFFWQTIRQGNTIERTEQWRDLDLPEASLIGTAYRANDDGQRRGPWIVRNVEAAPWLFAGTGLTDGATFGTGGIEIDHTSSASPRNVQVLAEIPNVLGKGLTAQMTYYETPAGAKVFGAGAFTLAGQVISNQVVRQLVANLWAHLAQP
jgi:hypothetical protein